MTVRKMITLGEFADALYKEYMQQVMLRGGIPTVQVDTVAKSICKELCWTTGMFEDALANLVAHINHARSHAPYHAKYRIAYHPDMTPTQAAGWNRRKRDNQIWIGGYPVFLIEMAKSEVNNGISSK